MRKKSLENYIEMEIIIVKIADKRFFNLVGTFPN